MNYTQTAPCSKCPFRSDIRAFLTKARVSEIEYGLVNGTFPCHATLDYSEAEENDGEPKETEHTQHCAGAMILLEKMERPSQMMRICERIGCYDRRKLKMDAPVFDTFRQMRAAQPSR